MLIFSVIYTFLDDTFEGVNKYRNNKRRNNKKQSTTRN